MKVYNTAGLTAVWREMAKVEKAYVNDKMKAMGHVLGWLDPNSVSTIAERTKLIDFFREKLKPKNVVEVGCGFSSRYRRFKDVKFHRLDLPYFSRRDKTVVAFDITKDKLDLDVKDGLFIIEGVTMYLQKSEVVKLLNQIKRYKGHILVDFLNKGYSSKDKSVKERLYKMLFKRVIGRAHLFDYRIENIEDGASLLKDLGFKKVAYQPCKVEKTLDALFYARL
jgi:O-methyltransferase involved in polyketide biosynthesis